MNGLQTLVQWREFFGHPQGSVLGLMNVVYPLGKVVSLPLITFVSDRYGRKIPLAVGLVACIAFAIMQGLAQNFATFVTARALLGFSTSFVTQPSPMLITELAYPTNPSRKDNSIVQHIFCMTFNINFIAKSDLLISLNISMWVRSLQRGALTEPSKSTTTGAGEFHRLFRELYRYYKSL